MPGVHALLSASASSRWLACPPSARLTQDAPDSTSAYAEEGTRAHALAEKTLKLIISGGSGSVESDNGEMREAIQRYVDVCTEKMGEAYKASPDAQMMVEHHLDFSHWVPDGFGTGDMVIISDKTLEVVDLKYGKGVPVSAKGNTQMRLYALGALSEFGILYDFDRVRMTIVQPRLDSVSADELSYSDLIAWGDKVAPIAKEAYAGKGEFKAGRHCRFCKARATCRTLAKYELRSVKKDFTEAPELEDFEISEIVQKAQEITSWLRDVEAYALNEAIKGQEWPGLKVVEGRSKRIITDPDAAAESLLSEQYSDEDIYKPQELQTLTNLTKLVGKKRLNDIIGKFIGKPKGKPTLVPDSDKRPPMVLDSITDEFEDELLKGDK
jgi:hypothetical protein